MSNHQGEFQHNYYTRRPSLLSPFPSSLLPPPDLSSYMTFDLAIQGFLIEFPSYLVLLSHSYTLNCLGFQVLRRIFATHGFPEMLVSDNRTAFTREEFRQFLKLNGIRPDTSAPYHPASNGLAERAVQTFKRALKKATPGNSDKHLQQFSFHYRITAHATTGTPPADLLLGRHPRSRLDLMTPSIAAKVEHSQLRQKTVHDQHTKVQSFNPVYAHSFPGATKWLPGVITAIKGPLSYEMNLTSYLFNSSGVCTLSTVRTVCVWTKIPPA